MLVLGQLCTKWHEFSFSRLLVSPWATKHMTSNGKSPQQHTFLINKKAESEFFRQKFLLSCSNSTKVVPPIPDIKCSHLNVRLRPIRALVRLISIKMVALKWMSVDSQFRPGRPWTIWENVSYIPTMKGRIWGWVGSCISGGTIIPVRQQKTNSLPLLPPAKIPQKKEKNKHCYNYVRVPTSIPVYRIVFRKPPC